MENNKIRLKGAGHKFAIGQTVHIAKVGIGKICGRYYRNYRWRNRNLNKIPMYEIEMPTNLQAASKLESLTYLAPQHILRKVKTPRPKIREFHLANVPVELLEEDMPFMVMSDDYALHLLSPFLKRKVGNGKMESGINPRHYKIIKAEFTQTGGYLSPYNVKFVLEKLQNGKSYFQ